MCTYNSSTYPFSKGDHIYYMNDYNESLAKIMIKDIYNLASPTLSRQETFTFFYEKLEKCYQIENCLNENKDVVFIISKKDSIIFKQLKSKYKQRIILDDRLYFYKRPFKLFVKLPIMFVADCLFSLWSRFVVPLPKCKVDFVFRSWFVPRSIKENKIRDEYFEVLQRDLDGKFTFSVFFQVHLKFMMKFISNFSKDEKRFVPQHRIMKLSDYIKVYLKSLFYRVRVKEKFLFKDRDYTTLLKESIKNDIYIGHQLSYFFEYYFVKRLYSDIKFSKLFFPFENQTWERVYPLLKSLGGLKCEVVGYQHTGLSYKFLNYFPSKFDANLPIFPDKIYTVGDIFKKLLSDEAHYPVLIESKSAIRFSKHVSSGAFKFSFSKKIKKNAIAYAFSFDQSKYKKTIEALISVFSGSEIVVYLKFHPLYNEHHLIKKSNLILPDNFLLVGDATLEDICSMVDCVLYDDNSVGIEAMIYGTRTMMLDVAEPIYDCERLFYCKFMQTKIILSELASFRDQLTNDNFNIQLDAKLINKYVNDYYSPYVLDSSYKQFIT